MGRIETVTAWGTFDGKKLHPGHMAFLNTCFSYGNVTVLLSCDDYIRERKLREVKCMQDVRSSRILATGLVQEVIIGTLDETENLRRILGLKPDAFCFGGDQSNAEDIELERRLTEIGAVSLHIPRTRPELYSTTLLDFSA